MIELHFDSEVIRLAMQNGGLDSLTEVPSNCIERRIEELEAEYVVFDNVKASAFFRYFKNTWMQRFKTETWNLTAMRDDNIIITNWTNNALENFNRLLNGEFGNAHPNMFHYVEVIKEIWIRKAAENQDVRYNGE